MIPEQETAFWDAIEAFDKEGLLPHVMLIGSWVEYIYSFYFTTNFKPSLRTTDADFLYWNIRIPNSTISISDALKEKGFIFTENRLTGVGKFVKGERYAWSGHASQAHQWRQITSDIQ